MLEHGGRLRAAAKRYGIPLADWIDLSTGIAPWAYPVPLLPTDAWQRLPEDDDGLEDAARAYYGARRALPLPGSQAAIQLLPRLRAPCRVLLPEPTYSEYAPAWRAAGHTVQACAFADIVPASADADVVMLGNPNNPTGERLARRVLEAMAVELARRDGWLIVDEAFADADPSESMTGNSGGNVIVLRSLGKFFGLAGARVGFALAADAVLELLAEAVGPWAVAHPARIVAQAALADRGWQAEQAARIQRDGERLHALLSTLWPQVANAGLFCYLPTGEAAGLFEFLARRGILLRAFTAPSADRVGLPADEDAWRRLTDALMAWRKR